MNFPCEGNLAKGETPPTRLGVTSKGRRRRLRRDRQYTLAGTKPFTLAGTSIFPRRVVPLLSTSKADSGLASEFRRDRAIYTAYERMLKVRGPNMTDQGVTTRVRADRSAHSSAHNTTTTQHSTIKADMLELDWIRSGAESERGDRWDCD